MSLKTLQVQLGLNLHLLKMNLDGISQEQSLVLPEPAGNSLNWVVGHLATTRLVGMLPLLGLESDEAPESWASYRRGTGPLPDRTQTRTLEELLDVFERTQQPITEALGEITAERLKEPAMFGGEEKSVQWVLTTTCFHESYHIGQTGLQRRLLGFAGALA
ncbi:MAG: DinB family protein [Acidobacteriota bacterium]